MTELRFVSDVHLGAVPEAVAGDFARSLASFVRETAAAGAGLVLLGDVFDLLEAVDVPAHRRESPPAQQDCALAALDAIAARHPALFEALGDAVADGMALHVVAGNHDAELTLPAVQAHLRSLVGGSPRVAFHPWLFRVPGVVHAEHGHLHHDVNRVDEPLGPAAGALRLPLGSHLPRRGAGRVATLRAFPPAARAALRLADPRRTARRDAYAQGVLAPSGGALGLAPATAARLLGVSAPTPVTVASRIVRKLVARGRDGDYLHAAAQRVHDVLSADGAGTSFYVFGHTHVAEVLPLEGATYVNCGTWSPFVSGRAVDRRPSYAVVRFGEDGGPAASVERWSGESRAR